MDENSKGFCFSCFLSYVNHTVGGETSLALSLSLSNATLNFYFFYILPIKSPGINFKCEV